MRSSADLHRSADLERSAGIELFGDTLRGTPASGPEARMGRAWVVLDDATAIPYRIESLSEGGAIISGGPVLPWRESFAMVLRMPGVSPLEVTARLAWQGAGRRGVRFVSADASIADAIEDVLLAPYAAEGAHVPVPPSGLASWLP